MLGWWRRWRRRRLARRPAPDAWIAILDERVPFFGALPEALRSELLDRLKIFVWEKHWEGAGGLVLEDVHKVVIGATAARLVLGLDPSYYDAILSIVVYPGHYAVPEHDGAVVLGQVHAWGTVVLSWQAVLEGLRSPTDGLDTTVHELAHALDLADGSFDGAPPLRAREDYRSWARVLQAEYDAMQDSTPRRKPVLRDYGATHPGELFAVASEVFFERPDFLESKRPELFAELRRFYGWDPITGAPERDLETRRPKSRRERNRRKRERRARRPEG